MTDPHALSRAAAVCRHPSVALVLGGGGARGLAHILMIEALDELGVRPQLIAGTSIGAVFGWAAASGISSRYMRAHALEVLGGRFDMIQTVLASSSEPLFRLLTLSRSALLKADRLLDLVMPTAASESFAELIIPLKVVATDFYGQSEVILESGSCRDAVAASIALPAVFKPVLREGRALMDGGLVNPLPFDTVCGLADLTIAIDVTGGPLKAPHRDHPAPMEALFASFNILERTIIQEKLRSRAPDILISPDLDRFRVLDFHKAAEILEAAKPAKEQLKRALSSRLDGRPSGPTGAVEVPADSVQSAIRSHQRGHA